MRLLGGPGGGAAEELGRRRHLGRVGEDAQVVAAVGGHLQPHQGQQAGLPAGGADLLQAVQGVEVGEEHPVEAGRAGGGEDGGGLKGAAAGVVAVDVQVDEHRRAPRFRTRD